MNKFNYFNILKLFFCVFQGYDGPGNFIFSIFCRQCPAQAGFPPIFEANGAKGHEIFIKILIFQ